MHRRPLLEQLQRYRTAWPDEAGVVDRMVSLVEGHADCFLRSCLPGHVTASAWIVSANGGRHLLTLHRKLGRWLQLGGHCDGDPDTLNAALREAQEESGLERLAVHPALTEALPFDVDVHVIPARGGARPELAHEHHDVRYLLVADPGQVVVCSDESHEVRWFTQDELDSVTDEESVLRMLRKCRSVPGLAAGA